MKKLILFILIISFGKTISQVAINKTSTSSKVALYLEAQKIPTTNFGGFKMPTVTETQQALIPVSTIDSSDDGLMVYVNDSVTGKRCWDIYDGIDHVWRSISCLNNNCSGEILFTENFNTYINNTGITGGSPSNGNYPAGVTKWTVSSYSVARDGTTNYPGTLINVNDYALVINSKMEFRDMNGPLEFLTQSINISGYNNFSISFEISESGVLEYYPAQHTDDFNCGVENLGSDYVDVEYSTDNGNTFTEVPNFSGNGNSNHTIADDITGTINFSISGISGTSLIIRICLQNWSTDEYYYLDNIVVQCN